MFSDNKTIVATFLQKIFEEISLEFQNRLSDLPFEAVIETYRRTKEFVRTLDFLESGTQQKSRKCLRCFFFCFRPNFFGVI